MDTGWGQLGAAGDSFRFGLCVSHTDPPAGGPVLTCGGSHRGARLSSARAATTSPPRCPPVPIRHPRVLRGPVPFVCTFPVEERVPPGREPSPHAQQTHNTATPQTSLCFPSAASWNLLFGRSQEAAELCPRRTHFVRVFCSFPDPRVGPVISMPHACLRGGPGQAAP